MAKPIANSKSPDADLELGDAPGDLNTWRGSWVCCFGKCRAVDWISCCAAFWVPCVAFGLTSAKVFRVSAVREAVKYVLVVMLLTFAYVAVALVRGFECVAPDAPAVAARRAIIAANGTVIEVLPGGPAELRQPAAVPEGCTAASWILYVLLVLALSATIYWAMEVSGKRRTQIRRRLGIPPLPDTDGDEPRSCPSCTGDCCVQYCCTCCALAQEMRTVLALERAGALPPPVAVGRGYEPIPDEAPKQAADMARPGEA